MMKAPRIEYLIKILRNGNERFDKETIELIDQIYQELYRLEPCGDDERRELWVKADRGTIEDYGDYDEFLEDEIVENYDDFKRMWKEEYPEETVWLHLVTTEYREYRAMSLGRELIYQSEPMEINGTSSGYPIHMVDFFSWLKEAVKSAVTDVENGIYNDDVRKNLPAKHRTGTIPRKDFWEAFPELRDDYFSEISKEEVDKFVRLASEQTEDYIPGEYRSQMTANDFYTFCSVGYAANGYEHCKGLSPKEQYLRMADGRDEGLSEIDENDPKAFEAWLNDRNRFGGHPWEVVRGGNSTHIDLYAAHDANGYYLALRGKSYGRSIETIKFYNALREIGIRVYLFDAKEMVARVKAEDLIGIVPDGIYPIYCEMRFPGMDILDFMNLPFENSDVEKILPKITWFEETQIKMKETE